MKLTDLDYKTFRSITRRLDIDSAWRKLVAETSYTRYRLTDLEVEKCAKSMYTGDSPSETLLCKWGLEGMTVETLIFYMDKLRLEGCLKYIKQPEPIHIIRQPVGSIRICSGKEIQIHCEALGFPYPEYCWFKGDVKLSRDKQGVLIIRCAKESHSGTYTCRVQHYLGVLGWKWIMSTPCTVQVDPANNDKDKANSKTWTVEELLKSGKSMATHLPQIILQPTNKSSSIGGPIIFKVVAQHPTDRLAYVWFYNNRPVPDANQSELRIEDVSRADAGSYQVQVYSVSNRSLNVMSNVAKLEVNPEPNQFTARDKVALVIGNGTYRSYGPPLPAVEHDLCYTTDAFEKMGFNVISLLDLTLEEMKRAVDFFCELVTEKAYVVFYCMGHGFLYDRRHFLVPWDLPQGNDVNESLCIEECMTRIQLKKPKLLMVLVDLCRQSVEHSQMEQVQKEKREDESLPNYVIIYATILGEQSFEEGSNKAKPRGLFNKYLLDVLSKPGVKVEDIYTQLQIKFQECQYNRCKYPQHPQMDITLEEPQRSLWDPMVCSRSTSDLNGVRREQDSARITDVWQFAHVIPGTVNIPLEDKGLVVLTFKKYLSNVLLMKPVITSFDERRCRIEVELIKDRVDQIVQVIKEEQPRCYKFCNLQRLKNKMTICMTISISTIPADGNVIRLETELIDLGVPLVSSIEWR